MEAQLCKSEVSATWNNGTSSLLILTKHIVIYILWQSSKITRALWWHFLAGLQATGLPPPGDLCPQLPAHLVQLTWRSESCHHHNHHRRRSRPLHHHPLCLFHSWQLCFPNSCKNLIFKECQQPFSVPSERDWDKRCPPVHTSRDSVRHKQVRKL